MQVIAAVWVILVGLYDALPKTSHDCEENAMIIDPLHVWLVGNIGTFKRLKVVVNITHGIKAITVITSIPAQSVQA